MLEISTSYSVDRPIIYKEIWMKVLPNYKDKQFTPNLDLNDLCTGIFENSTFSYTRDFFEFLLEDLEYELNGEFQDNAKMLRQMSELALKIENRVGDFLIKK